MAKPTTIQSALIDELVTGGSILRANITGNGIARVLARVARLTDTLPKTERLALENGLARRYRIVCEKHQAPSVVSTLFNLIGEAVKIVGALLRAH